MGIVYNNEDARACNDETQSSKQEVRANIPLLFSIGRAVEREDICPFAVGRGGDILPTRLASVAILRGSQGD